MLSLRQRIERAAVGVSGVVVLAVDLHGRICMFNAAAERLTGYPEPEVLGCPLMDLLLPTDEAGSAVDVLAHLAVRASSARHETEDWVTRDGVRRRLAFVITSLPDDAGRIAHLVWAGVDVTEQRRTQQLMEAVLHATTEQAVIATDRQGRITVFNAGAERMLGHTAEQALGRDVALLLHDPDELRRRAEALGVPVESVVGFRAQNGGADTQRWTYRRRDGSTLTVALSITALRRPHGESRATWASRSTSPNSSSVSSSCTAPPCRQRTGPRTTRSPGCPSAACCSSGCSTP